MPNVLLVVLDSVRASNCSIYGYPRTTTPYLDDFADNATKYTQARAPGPGSITSHVSMFTGLNVPEHELLSYESKLEKGHSVWESLQAEGMKTGAFTANPFFDLQPIGLTNGIDTVFSGDPWPANSGLDPTEYVGQNRRFLRDAIKTGTPIRSVANGLAAKLAHGPLERKLQPQVEMSGQHFVDAFLNWENNQNSDWAAVINLMDAHDPYLPKSEYDKWSCDKDWQIQFNVEEMIWEFTGADRPISEQRRLESLYDGAIKQVDAAVEKLVETLKKKE